MRGFYSVLGMALFFMGCAGPPSHWYELWEKENETPDEVRKALLECGAHNPFGPSTWPASNETSEVSRNDEYENSVRVSLCMLESGYQSVSRFRFVCDTKSGKDVQACKPENAHLIPRRDPSVRLNSAYCKHPIYSTYPACQP
ncbi:hypothetical protein [Hylemonella gracilis]|uniref:hypothetical protein n=1 Tax=Hylemonella gracilis TaxID=80880 RepID=UPI0012DBFE62|nr:hypothetical protein [Hylemonella gracilis]